MLNQPDAAPDVELTVRLRLRVVDPQVLREALEAREGPAADKFEEALRSVPANCIGRLVEASHLLVGLPGVVPTGSSIDVS